LMDGSLLSAGKGEAKIHSSSHPTTQINNFSFWHWIWISQSLWSGKKLNVFHSMKWAAESKYIFNFEISWLIYPVSHGLIWLYILRPTKLVLTLSKFGYVQILAKWGRASWDWGSNSNIRVLYLIARGSTETTCPNLSQFPMLVP
jgi:hypothetical protein